MPSDRDWEVERRRMVETQIRRRGIDDPRLLEALLRVPRERFVPPSARAYAYTDHALSIGNGQTISQPYMVAAMTDALELEGDERVLEIGTGSGYQAAVLAQLARDVYTVERIPELAEHAADLLEELGIRNVHIRVGDGTLGWPEEAPFQGIIVTAAAPDVPPSLLEQLDAEGGRLVAPVGRRSLQELLRIRRDGGLMERETLMGCRFVPLIGEEGWPE
ncbi:MAG: protein-L-isoaspartate(D-aspartate) O-methyltransferase [Gemmatimonadota bacterium]